MVKKAEIYVEPQYDKAEPIGTAFLSYSHEDAQTVSNVLETNLTNAGIPYFRDQKDIGGGDELISAIDQALSRSRCGIVVLSPRSIKSPWIWYETGILVGRQKTLLPFIVDFSGNRAAFIKSLPDFVRRYNVYWDVQELVNALRPHIFEFGQLVDDGALNGQLVSELRRATIDMTLEFPAALRPIVTFGYLLVRFSTPGRERGHTTALVNRIGLLNKPIPGSNLGEEQAGRKIRIRYILPQHRIGGTVFKPFVDVLDLDKQSEVIRVMKSAGLQDVRISDSAEKQRIYFLLPLSKRNLIKEPSGIVNNYLFPR